MLCCTVLHTAVGVGCACGFVCDSVGVLYPAKVCFHPIQHNFAPVPVLVANVGGFVHPSSTHACISLLKACSRMHRQPLKAQQGQA